MAFDHIGGDRDERLARAIAALDLRLAAHAAHPLVGAGRSVARSPCLWIVPSRREDIGTTAEQAPEQRDLVRGRRSIRDCRLLNNGWRNSRSRRNPRLLEFTKAIFQASALDVEHSELPTNGVNFISVPTWCHCSANRFRPIQATYARVPAIARGKQPSIAGPP